VSWLPKWLGLGPKEDTRLFLRLRLTRWRHLLMAERVCLDLLADLREKGKGEYIFDRQYLWATMGQIFQMGYQVAYDRGLLEKDEEAGMYLWLDRLKESATDYLQNWTPDRDKVLQENGPGNQFGGSANGELMALQEEPEYRMIKGLLTILDPPEASKESGPLKEKFETGMTLRQGLTLAHDRVLARLISPQAWPQWIKEGAAFQIRGEGSLLIVAVDLSEKSLRTGATLRTGGTGDTGQKSSNFPNPFGEGLESSPLLPETPPGETPSPWFMVFDESTFFLMSSSPSRTVAVDAVLTSIRKLNHFFFHWAGKPTRRPGTETWTDGFDWDRQEDQTFFEVYDHKKSAEEIRGLLKKVGIVRGYH
jgi:hypothetical protein